MHICGIKFRCDFEKLCCRSGLCQIYNFLQFFYQFPIYFIRNFCVHLIFYIIQQLHDFVFCVNTLCCTHEMINICQYTILNTIILHVIIIIIINIFVLNIFNISKKLENFIKQITIFFKIQDSFYLNDYLCIFQQSNQQPLPVCLSYILSIKRLPFILEQQELFYLIYDNIYLTFQFQLFIKLSIYCFTILALFLTLQKSIINSSNQVVLSDLESLQEQRKFKSF
ncbi:hypothetical protein FGO68_gene7566 [Halteria grandinella]|uniref:Transmembrane protein n=1 Tax=Halteria grandinella TaxID=5974 RepID=A0A8J8NI88_HALGN|nr:hypothetical protein FGO68_gene7566 [Halteria grandinella]